jgi:hypothetical protein
VTFSHRIILFTSMCVATLIGVLWVWPFSTASFPARIAQQLEAQTGFHLSVEGKTSLVIFPVPRIKMTGIYLKNPTTGAHLEALHLRGDVRLAALFSGRLELSDLLLKQPRLRTVDLQESSHLGPKGKEVLLHHMVTSASKVSTLQRLTLVDGTWEHHGFSTSASTLSDPLFVSQINGVIILVA